MKNTSHRHSHFTFRMGELLRLLALLPLAGAVLGAPACVLSVTNPGEGEGEGDGEGDACADPVLGGFELLAGYTIVDSAPLPAGYSAAARSESPGQAAHLLGLADDMLVYDLGAFPTLSATPEPLFDVLTDADQALAPGAEAFPSFLVAQGTVTATGYTRLSDFGGAVGQHSVGTGESSYLDAPANFAASVRGELALVNGAGLDAEQDGLGVYATRSAGTFLLASLGDGAVGSGYVAATSSGAVVLGRFTSENELFVLGPDDVDGVIGGGPALSLSGELPFLSGGVGALAAFGDDVAVATYDATTYAATGLLHVALPVSAGEVVPGVPKTVLQLREGCSSTMPFVAPWGDDLLVAIGANGGTRAVQIARQ